ncbi:hypothetical protein SAMN05444277_10915 [Parafilimonas terrae]|uniref:Uncharacterized protein n=1 Tax=Parafilimonas terrae TaxID=1465490 RepID=A0A1I5XKS8_9BACT|nr:hypothetical protein SAMN05444277_10915 [Parafilimonas terrae]
MLLILHQNLFNKCIIYGSMHVRNTAVIQFFTKEEFQAKIFAFNICIIFYTNSKA